MPPANGPNSLLRDEELDPWMERLANACRYANFVLAGQRRLDDITHDYDPLRARGVTVIRDWADGIDSTFRTLRLRGGASLGYDEAASQAMPDGGVVGLAIPDNSFRCPPGPYERISLITH